MTTLEQWRRANFDKLVKQQLDGPRIIVVYRPIWLHERNTTGKKCPCCGSKNALRTKIEEHRIVAFDRKTGERVGAKYSDGAKWQRLQDKLETIRPHCRWITCAIRCYADQLPIILDRQHTVIYAFGGNRSGKTQAACEWLWDQMLEKGGANSVFWWVAPTRELTRIAVEKFVTGEAGSPAPPLIPRELVLHWPKNHMSANQSIKLVDGTELRHFYASSRGGNMKGRRCMGAVMDEGTEVDHEINMTILLNRTMDVDGQVMVPTTPVAGHWLEEKANTVPTYDEVAVDDVSVRQELSCFANPWQSPEAIAKRIKELGGEKDPRVQREIFGRWVPEGDVLWRHWKPDAHTLSGISYRPEDYGLKDITNHVCHRLFQSQIRDKRCDVVAGWDVNDNPQSTTYAFVCVRDLKHKDDPEHWILVFMDEIVEQGTTFEHAKRLREHPYFRDARIVCDANACYPGTRANRQGQSADADILKKAGMAVVPPRYAKPRTKPDGRKLQRKSPANPQVRDRVNLCHELMIGGRWLVHERCTALLHSLAVQPATTEGLPLKPSNTVLDRVSGPTDASGYVAYAIWSQKPKPQILL